ncbi:membrane protein [Streptomyces mashuensis]|uniref:Membrane protein n=1 Tax=Streptomyces mashuensis TaxID=33904 RepID=A0A919B1M0_9ACTN|nr:TIGR02611 family protein [Streptomyces mashuensis]GHF39517.1 membrane protein [Streptomyces mashuensis]
MNAESDERSPADETAPADGTGPAAAPPGPAGRERPLGSRAPHFVRRSRALHLSWQAGVFVVGLAVVVAGVIMLPLPGPGWLVIFAGMAIWATEFVWAQLVLRWTKHKVTAAAQRALDPKVRRRNIALTVAGLAIAGVLVGCYLARYGLRAPWALHR